MSYEIIASDMKKLFDTSTIIPKQNNGRVTFNIPAKTQGWPRSGLEAYGLLVNCQDDIRGNIPSFLKIFKHDIPERAQRTQYLASLGLHKAHDWLFQGIPYGWFGRFQINGVEIIGHVAQQISGTTSAIGEDIQRLRDQGRWHFSLEDRKVLCGDLCAAVAAFEKLQLVHGDISTKNVMIARLQEGRAAAILCDYDGFYHPSQPLLPEIFAGIPCRPLGSSGFQLPQIVADKQKFVDTDRFALGVMICDILALESDGWHSDLQREELVGAGNYKKKNLSDIPKKIRDRCPDGFDLLELALKANDSSQLPSPEDWLNILGVSLHSSFNKPIVKVSKRYGNQVRLFRSANITKQQGSFSAINSDLNGISYQLTDGKLTIDIASNKSGFFYLRGKEKQVKHQIPKKVIICPDDIILVDNWQLEFLDS